MNGESMQWETRAGTPEEYRAGSLVLGDEWEITKKLGAGSFGAVYEIEVSNPEHVSRGVRRITVDGRETDRIPALPAGSTADVRVVMGQEEQR